METTSFLDPAQIKSRPNTGFGDSTNGSRHTNFLFLQRLPKGSQTPLLPWVAMLPTASSGLLAKVVPDTGFSCEKSPKNITSNPPNGRSVPSARRFQLSRFQVTLPIRMSRTPTSCAEIILTSSMRTQRKLCRFVANLCASLVRAVPSVSPTGMPDQWCKVQPSIWQAIEFWKARRTNCTPWVQPALAPPKQINL